MNLQFYMPTRVIMGDHCIRANASVFASLGKKALIVTGARSARVNGSLDDVTAALTAEKLSYSVFDKVMSNPTIACVYEGAAFAKAEGADFIVAIGGGSPMDAAKGIALLACQDIPEEELFSGRYGKSVLPMAFVPTTAGTGSEVTQYSILTNDRAETKTSIAAPILFPTVAFLDARYTEGLSAATAINTAVDALSHSVEGTLSVKANPITNNLAAESIRAIAGCFGPLKKKKLSPDERERLLYASTLGGMVIAHTGTTAVHSMGYSLTYFRQIDHGRANGLLLAAFLKYVEQKEPALIASVLTPMGFSAVGQLEEVLASLLGEKESISRDEFERYSSIAITAKNIANCAVVPTREDLLHIYLTSFAE